MKLYNHTFAVVGRGTFPMDMLRYDTCYPRTGDDVDRIIDDTHERPSRQVMLVAGGKPKGWQPTYERWASFGWSAERQHEMWEVK